MKNMLWIRHGQASLGSDNYDQLSEHGQRQSQKLGRFLGQEYRDTPLVLVHGPLQRQRHTAALMAEGMAEVGAATPIFDEDVGLAEYPAFRLFAHALPQFARAKEIDQLTQGDPSAHHPRLFKWLMHQWVQGKVDLEGTDILSFADFKKQVSNAFFRLVKRAEKEEVAAVTSGGPIGIALGLALFLEDKMSMEMAWRVSNSSVSRYRVEDGQAFLSGFHHHHHLSEEEVTFI